MDDRSVRELTPSEAHYITDYFHSGSHDFLWNMGVDPKKMPSVEKWIARIQQDFERSLADRAYYYLLWLKGQRPVGHSNLSDITLGRQANMHLHMWYPDLRKKGDGSYYIRNCLAMYFDKFGLRKVICEPNANNPAPNRLLKKVGFTFLRNHQKTPGFINYHQTLSTWEMERDTFTNLYG